MPPRISRARARARSASGRREVPRTCSARGSAGSVPPGATKLSSAEVARQDRGVARVTSHDQDASAARRGGRPGWSRPVRAGAAENPEGFQLGARRIWGTRFRHRGLDACTARWRRASGCPVTIRDGAPRLGQRLEMSLDGAELARQIQDVRLGHECPRIRSGSYWPVPKLRSLGATIRGQARFGVTGRSRRPLPRLPRAALVPPVRADGRTRSAR